MDQASFLDNASVEEFPQYSNLSILLLGISFPSPPIPFQHTIVSAMYKLVLNITGTYVLGISNTIPLLPTSASLFCYPFRDFFLINSLGAECLPAETTKHRNDHVIAFILFFNVDFKATRLPFLTIL